MSEARHVFLPSRYRVGRVICVSRYKAVWVLEICLGIAILLQALAGSAPMSQRSGDWGRWAFISDKQIVMGVGTTCKNRDEFFNFIVRVSG